jgi:hypothetical protein
MEGMKSRAVGLVLFCTGAALFLVGLLIPTSTAASGIELMRLSQTSASPGDGIVLGVGCGGCPLKSTFPISLVPVKQAPQPHRCTIHSAKLPKRLRENALCDAEAADPPRDHPYVFLGRTSGATALLPSVRPPGSKSHLHFRVPKVKPGLYAFVIFCAECARGPRGALITETGLPHRWLTHKLLRVQPPGAPDPRKSESGGAGPWGAIAAGLASLASAALLLFPRL